MVNVERKAHVVSLVNAHNAGIAVIKDFKAMSGLASPVHKAYEGNTGKMEFLDATANKESADVVGRKDHKLC